MNIFLTALFIFFSLCVVHSQTTTMDIKASPNSIGSTYIGFDITLNTGIILPNNSVITAVIPPEFVQVNPPISCTINSALCSTSPSSPCICQFTLASNTVMGSLSSFNSTKVIFSFGVFNHFGISNKTKNFSVTVSPTNLSTYTISQEVYIKTRDLTSKFYF